MTTLTHQRERNREKPINLRELINPEERFIGSSLLDDSINSNYGFYDRLKKKPFWVWEEGEGHKRNGDCCFNHIIGLPENKPGLPQTIFDFQERMIKILEEKTDPNTDGHVWIKKATGIGGTAIYLRAMVWLALREQPQDYGIAGSNMCILTGPNHSLATDLIQRVRGLFVNFPELKFPINSTKRILIKNVMFQSYPSMNIDAMRGIPNVSFVLADEFAFFGKHQQDNESPRTTIERYFGKSDPWAVLMSTPGLSDDMFGSIEFEKNPPYKRLELHYSLGVGKVYTAEDIERAKATPSFRREYELEYLGVFGDYFKPETIEAAEKRGETCMAVINDEIRQDTRKSMGVDAGYGSEKDGSAFGICITQINPENQLIETLFAEEYERPDFNDMIDLILRLYSDYHIDNIYIDASNEPVINSLKKKLHDRMDYREQLSEIRKIVGGTPANYMKVVPIAFNSEGRQMLYVTYMMLDKRWLSINSRFNKLLISLRTAVARGDQLDKTHTRHDDVLDAYRLSLKHYRPPDTK